MKKYETKGGRTFRFSSGKDYVVHRRRAHAGTTGKKFHEWVVVLWGPKEGINRKVETDGWGYTARSAFDDIRGRLTRQATARLVGDLLSEKEMAAVISKLERNSRRAKREHLAKLQELTK